MRTLHVLLQSRNAKRLLKIRGLRRENDFVLEVRSLLDLAAFKQTLEKIITALLAGDPPLETLIKPNKLPFIDKFDRLLPPSLLLKQYVANMLDPEELDPPLFPGVL
jgi:hypothetical protein